MKQSCVLHSDRGETGKAELAGRRLWRDMDQPGAQLLGRACGLRVAGERMVVLGIHRLRGLLSRPLYPRRPEYHRYTYNLSSSPIHIK